MHFCLLTICFPEFYVSDLLLSEARKQGGHPSLESFHLMYTRGFHNVCVKMRLKDNVNIL